MRTRLRNWVVGVGAVLSMALALASPALAQGVMTITDISNGPNIGKVAAGASGNTFFQIDPGSGALTKLSGSGSLMSTSSSSVVTVTVTCTSANCTNGGHGKILATGSPSGRAGPLTAFTVSNGATLTGTSPTTFTVPALNKNQSETFRVGMNFPIEGDDSGDNSGSSYSSFLVQIVAGTGGTPSGSQTGSAYANVNRGLSVTKSADLSFGAVVRPSSGNGSISLSPITGAVTVTGTNTVAMPQSRLAAVAQAAMFTFTGEGCEDFTISIPGSILMTGPGSATLRVTTSATTSGTQNFYGDAGHGSTFVVKVGGSVPLASNTPSGAYTGSFTVTATYD